MKWEYGVISVSQKADEETAEKMEDILNSMGEEGWELVTTNSDSNNEGYFRCIFKRRKAG